MIASSTAQWALCYRGGGGRLLGRARSEEQTSETTMPSWAISPASWYPGLRPTGHGLLAALSSLMNRAGLSARGVDADVPVPRLLRGLSYPIPDCVVPCPFPKPFDTICLGRGRSTSASDPQGDLFRLAALAELMGLPHLFAPASALALCHSKGQFKAFVHGLGLPTAPFWVLEPGMHIPDELGHGANYGPGWFLKPESGSHSTGIDPLSVIQHPIELPTRLQRFWQTYHRPALLEQFLPGREWRLAVLETANHQLELLPILEIETLGVRDEAERGRPNLAILTMSAQQEPGSPADRAWRWRCPALGVSRTLRRELEELAFTLFRASGCRDAAEIDIRLDAQNRPMILEMHPIPDLTPMSAWSRAVRASGKGLRAIWQAWDEKLQAQRPTLAQSQRDSA